MPKPTQILEARQLVVEGQDAAKFFAVLLREIKLPGIQIQNHGGISELPGFLRALKATPGFSKVTSLGIVRDAEGDCSSAMQSVRSALRSAGLSEPEEPIEIANGEPNVSVFILPDCSSPGMLESLCLNAVQDDMAMPCVEAYFDCLERKDIKIPANMIYKARLHAFLASRQKPDLQIGEAADKGYLNLEHPIFDPLKHFLARL